MRLIKIWYATFYAKFKYYTQKIPFGRGKNTHTHLRARLVLCLFVFNVLTNLNHFIIYALPYLVYNPSAACVPLW